MDKDEEMYDQMSALEKTENILGNIENRFNSFFEKSQSNIGIGMGMNNNLSGFGTTFTNQEILSKIRSDENLHFMKPNANPAGNNNFATQVNTNSNRAQIPNTYSPIHNSVNNDYDKENFSILNLRANCNKDKVLDFTPLDSVASRNLKNKDELDL